MVERQTYTLKEYAVLLGCSLNTVKARLNRGEIPGEKIGRLWLIKKPAVDKWLAEQPVKRDEEAA
jgi:excisionase family DNA binding protein